MSKLLLFVRRLLDRLGLPFLRVVVLPGLEPELLPQPQPAVAAPATISAPHRSKADIKDIEETGTFYYLSDLLDQLDYYFKYIRYLKNDDPESYNLYSQTGGQIVSTKGKFWTRGTEPLCRDPEKMPAFTLLSNANTADTEDTIACKMWYFRKLHGFARIECTNGVVYECVLYYVERKNPDVMRLPAHFYISVTGDGSVTVLKQCYTENQQVGNGHWPKHPDGGRSPLYLRRSVWRHGEAVTLVAEFNKITVHRLAQVMFYTALNASLLAQGGFRVTAKKAGVRAIFGIDMLRTPYFFRDRDFVANAAGSRQRIFHIVRTHERHYADGHSSFVRSHFRGARRFMWNGYAVIITMPGFHHGVMSEFDLPAAMEGYEPKEWAGEPLADSQKLGGMLADHVEH